MPARPETLQGLCASAIQQYASRAQGDGTGARRITLCGRRGDVERRRTLPRFVGLLSVLGGGEPPARARVHASVKLAVLSRRRAADNALVSVRHDALGA